MLGFFFERCQQHKIWGEHATFGTIEISALWLDWCIMLDMKNFDTGVV